MLLIKGGLKMKKVLFIWGLLLLTVILSACGGAGANDYPVPDELVNSSEPGKEDFKSQFGLKIGETGYVVDVPNKTALAITLNEVKILDEFEGDSPSADRFYVLGNFTVSNFGENFISNFQMEYPYLARTSAADKIADGSLTNSNDLIGSGSSMKRYDTIINSEALHPGEEMTGDMLITAEEKNDSYLIWFGYQGYSNDITFEFAASEAKTE